MVLLSGAVLFASLFLTWSRLSPAYLTIANQLQALQGVPHDPNAWQVYSAADVALAVLAGSLIAVALIGSRLARMCAILAAFLALGFAIHAANVPPTNGAADAFQPSLGVPSYVPASPSQGAGETLAIVALLAALTGLAVSLTAD